MKGFSKFARRSINITPEQFQESKDLLSAMGVPYIVVSLFKREGLYALVNCLSMSKAPGEAEAQCAAFARAGKVYAAGSEDMDTLTFGSPIVLRRLSSSDFKKIPILEINLKKALEELKISYDQVSNFRLDADLYYPINTYCSLWICAY